LLPLRERWGHGRIDVSGGTFTDGGWLILNRVSNTGTASNALLNVTSGTVNFVAAPAGVLSMGNQANGAAPISSTSAATGSILGPNVAAYTLDMASGNNSATTTNIVNPGTGGTLQIAQVVASQANPTAVMNFNGGTLKAVALSPAAFLSAANIDAVNVYGAGAP